MIKIETFPVNHGEYPEQENLQVQTYGKRITKDQTVYEYLLEFLLVFISKKNNKSGFEKVENFSELVEGKCNTNIGLKRFIFLNSSKRENIAEIDREANKYLEMKLSEKMNLSGIKSDELIKIIRELYLGFTAFSGDRGWFAKSLLPMTPEVIFPEAMGKLALRNSNCFEDVGFSRGIPLEVDTKFEFSEHNFMARGGEVYFTHLVQGLSFISYGSEIEGRKASNELDCRLNNLINSFPQFSELSSWIQNVWDEGFEEDDEGKRTSEIKCKWIPKEYERRSKYSVKELTNLLKSDINTFEKFELMSIGIVIQILRMMTEGANIKSNNDKELPWIVHISGTQENEKIKKIAVEAYKNIEERMVIAVSNYLENIDEIKKKKSKKTINDNQLLKKGHEDSFKLLRKIGKDIGFVIPIKGSNMRFTLNDNIIKFLVISLIEPGKKVTLDTFLNKLYEHFRIIIGPNIRQDIGEIDVSCLQYNLDGFNILLRKNGFLKELSDSTSIVFNPYDEVII